jgi:hypothetical protein
MQQNTVIYPARFHGPPAAYECLNCARTGAELGGPALGQFFGSGSAPICTGPSGLHLMVSPRPTKSGAS